MFSRESAASSACLAYLVRHLKVREFRLFDVQFMTDHLRRFGAIEIPRDEYLLRLRKSLLLTCGWQGG